MVFMVTREQLNLTDRIHNSQLIKGESIHRKETKRFT
jgi:hypothetical protein